MALPKKTIVKAVTKRTGVPLSKPLAHCPVRRIIVFICMGFLYGCTSGNAYIKQEGYKQGRLHKAIAADWMSNSGWSANCPTVEEAMRISIENCEKTWKTKCKVVEIDGIPFEEFDFQNAKPIKPENQPLPYPMKEDIAAGTALPIDGLWEIQANPQTGESMMLNPKKEGCAAVFGQLEG